jgi:hypothetical protein
MLTWLGVSSSGFYEWRRRPQSATAARREKLKQLITVIFEMSDETYGYRRIHAALLRSGHACSPELVRALVRDLGLVPCQPRPWRHSLTDQDPAAGPIPDLLHRDFTATALGGLGIPRHRDRLLHESGNRVGDVRQLQDSAHQRSDQHGSPQSAHQARRDIPLRPRLELYVRRISARSCAGTGSGNPSGVLESATTTRWPSHSSRH